MGQGLEQTVLKIRYRNRYFKNMFTASNNQRNAN